MTRDSSNKLRLRRRLLVSAAAFLGQRAALARVTSHESRATPFAKATPGRILRFPDDEGSHPAFRVEWWYVTGLLDGQAGRLGFQITFFRTRPDRTTANPSAFSPNHVLIAHAALSDPREGRLLHQQSVARAGFGLAEALEGRTAVWIDGWRMEQRENLYRVSLPFDGFGFELELTPTQPPLLNGDHGYSRKGPHENAASYYYSLPQLDVRGTVRRTGGTVAVTGRAWLDHEWTSSYLDERAQGWDWIGINLADGGALMAFRMRTRDQSTLWAGATLRSADGAVRVFQPGEVQFAPLRHWQSPRTATRYPIAWQVRLGDTPYTVEPLMDDQEQDARSTTGTVYWEGAVRLLEDGRATGAGYLELTGYRRPLKL